jgi:hypothetical protein
VKVAVLKSNLCLCCRELLDSEFRQVQEDLLIMRQEVLSHGNNGVNIPVNLRRLIVNAQTAYDCGPYKPPVPGELTAVEVVNRIRVSLGDAGSLAPVDCCVEGRLYLCCHPFQSGSESHCLPTSGWLSAFC